MLLNIFLVWIYNSKKYMSVCNNEPYDLKLCEYCRVCVSAKIILELDNRHPLAFFLGMVLFNIVYLTNFDPFIKTFLMRLPALFAKLFHQ